MAHLRYPDNLSPAHLARIKRICDALRANAALNNHELSWLCAHPSFIEMTDPERSLPSYSILEKFKQIPTHH